MSYTESELAEALDKALDPEANQLSKKVIENRKLVQSLRSVIETVPYLGSANANHILEQEDQFKQIR